MFNRVDKSSDKTDGLARRFRQHIPGAMADLYYVYCRLAYLLIVRMVNNPEVAQELTQETFLRAWNQAELLLAIEDDRALGPWLLAIARKCALDYLAEPADPNTIPLAARSEIFQECAILFEEALGNLLRKQIQFTELVRREGPSRQASPNTLSRPLDCVKGRFRSALSWLRGDRGVRAMKVAGPS
jgi:RNA polymerase sigma-70 factor (ECF subfamily)